MKYDLEKLIDRDGTYATKWETYTEGNKSGSISSIGTDLQGDGLLPMWVADMDFKTAQPIIDALTFRAQHGIFGYTLASENYFQSIINWFESRYGWKIDKEWIIPTSGVVPAIQFAINTFCSRGNAVLIQGPVYHPFYRVIKSAGCHVVSNSLIHSSDGYKMDFEDLEEKVKDKNIKLAILCSPHNPVGRVWSREELRTFGKICIENGVLIIADEIHCDLVAPEVVFTPFLKVNELFLPNTIVCTAPSKTFNLAGMHLANTIIADEHLRKDYKNYMVVNSVAGGLNPFSLIAAEVAYNKGGDWLEQVLIYIWANYEFLKEFIDKYLPRIILTKLEGTYLAWVDFRCLNLEPQSLEDLIQNKAKLLFNQGYIFGDEGIGFQRINIACPRKVLELGLWRLKEAIEELEI